MTGESLRRRRMPVYGARDCRYQAAIVQDGNVLLLRVRDPYSGHRFWLVPGGGREGTEAEEDCVRREVSEETGLEVDVDRLLWEEAFVDDRTYRRSKTYLCRSRGGVPYAGREPEEGEHEHHVIEEVAWFALDHPESWGRDVDEDPITSRFLTRLIAELAAKSAS